MAGKKKKLCTRYTKTHTRNTACPLQFRSNGGISTIDRIIIFNGHRYANNEQCIDGENEATVRYKQASITTGPCEIS